MTLIPKEDEGFFVILHRQLSNYELLLEGNRNDTKTMYVTVSACGVIISFPYDIPSTETFRQSLDNICAACLEQLTAFALWQKKDENVH
jgi:hypothetical protein